MTIFHSRCCCLCVGLIYAALTTGAQADITYVLNPGATITPVDGSIAIGPTESITGSFTWHPSNEGNIEEFDATTLDFTSHSFTLILDTTPANDYASDTFAAGGTNFTEVVDTTGLPQSLLIIQSELGQYVGNYLSPTEVIYQTVRLVPPSGGLYEADLTFSATAVPEPTTGTFAILGITALLTYRHRSTRDLMNVAP